MSRPDEPAAAGDDEASGTHSGGTLLLRPERRQRSLRWRFVAAISALVAVVLAAVSLVLTLVARDYLRDELEAHSVSYARLAAAPVCDAYQTYFASGFSKFRELVLEVGALSPDLEALAVHDTEGRRLFDSRQLVDDGFRAAPRVADEARLLAGVRGLDVDAWPEVGGDGESRFVVVVPYVEQWGRHRYSAVFFFSYEGLHRALGRTYTVIALLATLALGLGVACAVVLAGWSLVPIRRLTRGARRLGRGELQHRIGLSTGDEFEVLGETLDRMAERLGKNVDELERSNRRLERLNRELQELDKTKNDLLANVSHELRTPLTAISGYVEALESGLLGELEPTQRRSLEVVEKNVRRLRALIDQLLSFARMESGRLVMELRAFALAPVVEHVVDGMRAAHGADAAVRVDVAADLPEVYGDPGRIGQVIENLVSNAIKFSAAGAPVEVAAREVAGGLEVTVRDRGIGLAPDQQERIFDRFYQVDATSRRRVGGIGLGLAIVREILAQHHASIAVDSRPGEGATFRFVLPLAIERTGVIRLPAIRSAVVIDDDGGFVHDVAAYLSAHGWAIDTAASAEQGMAAIRRILPDVVVLDRVLPDDDGFVLLESLKSAERFAEIPIVVVSVRREKALGLRLGAARYLVKPVSPEAVEEAMLEVLAEARERRIAARAAV